MLRRLLFSTLGLLCLSATAQIDQAKVEAFVTQYASTSGKDPTAIRAILDSAVFKQDIIDKLNRPAEGMAWHRYRSIFMKEERIEAGVDFWREHQEVLKQVSDDTGVPEHIVLGILGVETYFGGNKGSYKVLDALYTIAFGYPKRSRYFTKELGEYLDLVEKEGLDVFELEGSYAGAMGYSQFMPSSYRAYAVSYDEGGTRDLVNSPEDAIASIANYLKVHRWKRNQLVAVPAIRRPDATPPAKFSARVKYDVAHYQTIGFDPEWELTPTRKVALLEYEEKEDPSYWFGLHNFYVITRYNHSPMYALVVYQLGEAIKKRRGGL